MKRKKKRIRKQSQDPEVGHQLFGAFGGKETLVFAAGVLVGVFLRWKLARVSVSEALSDISGV
jgi:hypothetical protein